MQYVIIRIKVASVDDRSFRYRDSTTGAVGSAELNGHSLEVGAVLTVKIDPRLEKLIQFVGPQPMLAAAPLANQEKPEEHSILINGKPFVLEPDDPPVAVGQVRSADVSFTSHWTAARDAGRSSKKRPAIVVDLDGNQAGLPSLHGTNTFVARHGGRLLSCWREIGLQKASAISRQQIRADTESFGPLIGNLLPEDRQRLNLPTL